MKIALENCLSICVGKLQKAIRKTINRDYPESTEEEIHNFTERDLLSFTINNQTFKYTSLKNRLGGHRWFFLCPKCGRRVSKLFMPPENYGLVKQYQCKECHGLRNQSAIMGQNKFYRRVTRPLKRMKDLEDRLARGHLNSDKIQELLNEYDALEKELKSSPEYRLYQFKRRRGMNT